MQTNLKRPFILIAVMLGMFLSAIEATIVATAMPSIVADLQYFSLYSWVFSAYLLSSSATMLIFGKLADIYGRRPIYIYGASIFLIGSVLAGASTSMVMLIFSRFIQGIGAGALMPIATTIVGDIYSTAERAKIQGYLSAVWGISAVFGPLLGAFIVDFSHWRYVFWMNIPLGLVSIFGIAIFLKEDIEKKKQKINLTSSLVFMLGITLLMYVFVEGGVKIPWQSPAMYSLLAILFIIFSIFYWNEKRVSAPLILSPAWSYRMIQVANIASLLSGVIVISISSYLPTFVQGVMGESPIIAGFTLTTMSIGWPIASTIAGRLLLKVGYRNISILGSVFLVIGTIFFVTLPSIQNYIWAGLGSFFVGVGMGMTSTAFIVAIQSTVSWELRGVATATNMFMRSIGSAIGVAFLGGLLNSQMNKKIVEADLDETLTIDAADKLLNETERMALNSEAIIVLKEGLLSGLQYVYFGIACIAIITFITILYMPHKMKERVREEGNE